MGYSEDAFHFDLSAQRSFLKKIVFRNGEVWH